jgi:hypothetical protein
MYKIKVIILCFTILLLTDITLASGSINDYNESFESVNTNISDGDWSVSSGGSNNCQKVEGGYSDSYHAQLGGFGTGGCGRRKSVNYLLNGDSYVITFYWYTNNVVFLNNDRYGYFQLINNDNNVIMGLRFDSDTSTNSDWLFIKGSEGSYVSFAQITNNEWHKLQISIDNTTTPYPTYQVMLDETTTSNWYNITTAGEDNQYAYGIQLDMGTTAENEQYHRVDNISMLDLSADPIPSFSLTQESINVEEGTMTLGGSGDFMYTGEDYWVNMDIYLQCERIDDEDLFLDNTVAYIQWFTDDDDYDDVTRKKANNFYIGAGYDDEDSTYSFNDVVVPFKYGMNCTYPAHINIWNGPDIVYSSTYGYDPNEAVPTFEIVPSISTSNSAPALTTEQTGFMAWLWNGLDKFVSRWLGFGGLKLRFQQNMFILNNTLDAKAPFGYIRTALDLDTVQVQIADSVPSFIFEFGDIDYLSIDDVEVSIPDYVQTVFTALRTVLSIIIWFMFFAYIVRLARGIFDKEQ